MQKALFLDRDGVVNVEKKYLFKIEDFEFIDGIIELCKYYISNGYMIFIVTNQSGIARNYYNENDFQVLTLWMINEFFKYGIEIQNVYHCPHHPSISGECICRKPNIGMILEAKNDFNLDLVNSVIIGDKESDIEAGINAGLRDTYLFDSLGIIKNSKASKIVSKLENIWKIKC